jgi:hypothetical protein
MGKTAYPPGVDGHAVMRRTAEELQAVLCRLAAADATVRALDDDMLEVHISGMHARYLMAIMCDAGLTH